MSDMPDDLKWAGDQIILTKIFREQFGQYFLRGVIAILHPDLMLSDGIFLVLIRECLGVPDEQYIIGAIHIDDGFMTPEF